LAGVKHLLVHSGNPAPRGFRADWGARYCFWPLQAMDAKVICCSDYVRDQVRAIPLIRKSMFHSVWNCARVSGVSDRAAAARLSREEDAAAALNRTIIMVATLENHKDHPTLIRALGLLIPEFPKLRLVLVGDGSRRAELERLAQQAGVAHAVNFMGTRMDVPELLGTADVFVFATTPQEGLGTVLIEALAAGLPIVASDVPACRELLQDGAWGSLVPANSPVALAEAISETLRSDDAETSQRSRGQEFANSFTPEQMISNYLKLVGIEVPHD
jgi:glycosyltransferase involved in cell wall biosynthesis